MAGLLDFNNPEMRMGLGLLALGQMPKAQGFQGLMGLLANEGNMRQEAMREKLLQSQIEENAIQNRQREQQMALALKQQEMRDRMLFGGGVPTSGEQPAQPSANAETAQQAGGILALAKQLNMPPEVIQADYAFNGGKKIAELLDSRSKPNWQNINGNLVNTNAPGFTGGLQAGLSAGSDGRVTAWQPDEQGGLVVGAPRGALDTYRAYQGTQADFKPIKVWNPATQREEFTSERNVVQGAPNARPQQQYSGPGYNGGSAAEAAKEQLFIMQREYDKLPPGPDRDAVAREMQRLGGAPGASGNYAAGPSAAEQAANEAARTRAVDTAKADVVRDTDSRNKVRSANENLTNADRAIELLKMGPTGSGVGSLIDKGAAVFGKSTPGGNIAAQLDIVSANMVKNVPRFEGPQSNIDVEGYKSAAGRVADRTLPIEQRLAAAQEVKYFEQKAIRQAQGGQGGGATGNWGEPQQKTQQREFSMLPNATQFDGKRMQAPDGTIYRSRGGKWVKE